MALYKCGGAAGEKYVEGTFTSSTSTTVKVTLGFKPVWLFVYFDGVVSSKRVVALNFYDESAITDRYFRANNDSSGGSYTGFQALSGGTYQLSIASIDNDGFTMNKVGSTYNGTWHYIALKTFD